MRRPALLIPLGALLVLLALGLAGCGDDSTSEADATTSQTTSQTDSNAAFCASLTELEDATDDLKALDPTATTITELTTTATNLVTAATGVLTAAKDDVSIDTAALSQAWDNVTTAIGDIPGSGQSASQAVNSLKTALEPLEQAADDLRPNCEDGGTGTTTS